MTPAAPRIAAVIGHADELALLEQCIAHHAALGVTHFVVSADTAALRHRDELRALEQRGDVRVLYRNEDDEGFHVFAAAFGAAAEWADPSWIVMLDSDEFCVCEHGDLRLTAALSGADIVELPRFNVPPIRTADGAVGNADASGVANAWFIGRPRAVDLSDLSDTAPAPWIMSRIMPRAIVRPSAVAAVHLGGHDVMPRDAQPVRAVADDACVLHLPFTTLERFERKVERIVFALTAFGHRYGPNDALHWRRWAALAARGALAGEFERQVVDDETARALIAGGELVAAPEFFAASRRAE